MERKPSQQKEAALVAHQVNSDNQEQSKYVVVREGHRVSTHEYTTTNDPKAIEECKFWEKIAKKHSWGEPVNIVAYDNKLHRIW